MAGRTAGDQSCIHLISRYIFGVTRLQGLASQIVLILIAVKSKTDKCSLLTFFTTLFREEIACSASVLAISVWIGGV